jgi:hypothetical protein
LSAHISDVLRLPAGHAALTDVPAGDEDDRQVALFLLQQISYRRVDDVDPAWEDDETFLTLRARLEADLERELRVACARPSVAPEDLLSALDETLARGGGPSLSTWMEEEGTLEHLREFVVHRAAYQLQEADPHTFAIPRLASGICKTAMLELQLDEYGGHEPTESHAELFAATMTALELDPVADIDRLPAVTLATNTLLNRLGRSRRLLGACLGHLAVFEMTSVEPMARYAAAVRRLAGDAGTAAARFYDVHVAADGFHEQLARDRLLAGFVDQHPDEVDEVIFGATALMHVERQLAEHLIRCWEQGRTSLRDPLPGSDLRPHRHLTAA